MSNIAVHEILALTAAAFGVTAAEMARPRRGRRKADWAPWPVVARGAVVILAERHTMAETRDLATAFGRDKRRSVGSAGENLRRDAAKTAAMAVNDANIRLCMQAIEDQIDALHEARLEAMERATAAGFGGLAAIARNRGLPKRSRGPRRQTGADPETSTRPSVTNSRKQTIASSLPIAA